MYGQLQKRSRLCVWPSLNHLFKVDIGAPRTRTSKDVFQYLAELFKAYNLQARSTRGTAILTAASPFLLSPLA